MAKKKSGGGGGANWMDTYGDMVTLLLCFFVLLYSMSTISEDKWKALVQSFNPMATLTTTDPNGKGGSYSDPDVGDQFPGLVDPSDLEAQQADIEELLTEMAAALEQMAADEGLASAISVELTGGKIYVKFSDTVFFGGNSADLKPEAKEVLLKVCAVLDAGKSAIEEIRIQGHTAQASNTTPNEAHGDRELASDRAMEVVVFIQENSTIHPARLISEGYGQWRPIDDNQGEEGKAPNRRVEMIISGVDLENNSELSEALSKFISLDGGEP
ncbi:MAG: flagellar motor protein MotB [Clostridiales bacterium]|nr:flagellar motor protein MotB [Clostridiales bacterium]